MGLTSMLIPKRLLLCADLAPPPAEPAGGGRLLGLLAGHDAGAQVCVYALQVAAMAALGVMAWPTRMG